MMFVTGCICGAALAACGGGGEEMAIEPEVIVCRAADLGCRQTAQAMKSRACLVMPEGLHVYLDEIEYAQLKRELKGLGAWTLGNWIEGEDCDA